MKKATLFILLFIPRLCFAETYKIYNRWGQKQGSIKKDPYDPNDKIIESRTKPPTLLESYVSGKMLADEVKKSEEELEYMRKKNELLDLQINQLRANQKTQFYNKELKSSINSDLSMMKIYLENIFDENKPSEVRNEARSEFILLWNKLNPDKKIKLKN